MGLGHHLGQPLSRPCSSGCSAMTPSRGSFCPPGTTGSAMPKQRAQKGLLPGCSAVPFPGGMPLHMGCTATAGVSRTRGRRQGCVPAGPRCATPQARPASPVPGYRQLSRQHTPTHHKHLAQVVRIPSSAHCPAGLALGGGCSVTPQRPVAPKVPFPMCGARCCFGAHQAPMAPGRGEGVLGVEQGAGCGAGCRVQGEGVGLVMEAGQGCLDDSGSNGVA